MDPIGARFVDFMLLLSDLMIPLGIICLMISAWIWRRF